ncbi:50S ribosomal protein L28 [Candidatus Purcelliella pentastirinorum]|nr:50S ribosomal protein L28 [Candidatus Purcelliella pentastirinorum]WDI78861.1 50S ribosomal protein L28 [Candidatus Purcelliella pentastirinorum]WDR79994.1 50S ribosomal protein L28 [Candidatus Purcelliella pentastirinorum]
MSRLCCITGKRPIVGNHRSHAMNAIKRRFYPNLHFCKFWSESKNCFIKLRVSIRGMRIINKLGIDAVFTKYNIRDIKY